MKKRILLVGCGNIGRRHLEGLIKLHNSIIVDIVEPNFASQKTAKTIIEKNSKQNKKFLVSWFTDICEIKKKSDVVIVATNSKGRANLILDLFKQGHDRFIVEKIVCQSKTEYSQLLTAMKKYNAKLWVNTTRRYFKSYQKIKCFFKNKPIIVHVDGGNFGLATNSIHMLDLFSWLIDDYDVSLTGIYLKKILPNKRGNDFVEFTGTLIGNSKNGSLITITSHDEKKIPLTITLTNKNIKIILDETNSKIVMNTGKKFHFTTEFVSNISHLIIRDILKNDTCQLPKLENSFIAHTELFRVFNQHLKKTKHRQLQLCPIT